MKITKKPVSAGCCGKCDHRKTALTHIQAAMDELALVEDDPVCQDSIANLSVVFIDLCPCDGPVESESVDLSFSDPENMKTVSDEGMVQ